MKRLYLRLYLSILLISGAGLAGSAAGSRAQAEQPLPTAPRPPMALTAVVMSAYQVDLYWPAVPGVQGYRLLRDGHPLATLDAATLFFEDTAVQPAASYDYSVEA